MSDKPIFWQVSVTDGDDPWFREGNGWDELTMALKDIALWVEQNTPEGFIPSGNVSLYWKVDQRKAVSA